MYFILIINIYDHNLYFWANQIVNSMINNLWRFIIQKVCIPSHSACSLVICVPVFFSRDYSPLKDSTPHIPVHTHVFQLPWSFWKPSSPHIPLWALLIISETAWMSGSLESLFILHNKKLTDFFIASLLLHSALHFKKMALLHTVLCLLFGREKILLNFHLALSDISLL